MARLPVDKEYSQEQPYKADKIWEWIRTHGALDGFSCAQIAKDTGINPRTVSEYVERLSKGGILVKDSYRLVVEPSKKRPSLRTDGSAILLASGTQNMWRTMRMLRDFTAAEITAHAHTPASSVALSTAKKYITALKKAGYLRVVIPSRPAHPARYRLIKNTGPIAPKIQKSKAVFDPNLRKVIGRADDGQ